MTNLPIPTTSLAWNRIHTLVFAGGGNRCMWQGGLLEHLLSQGLNLPRQLVGTSAGAAMAASFLSAGPRVALEACQKLYGANMQLWMGQGLQKLRLQFAHQHIYPAWLESFVSARHFEAIRQSATQLKVAVMHPTRWLGLKGSVLAASAAYLLDKKMHSIHPRLPRWLGLRLGFYSLNHSASAEAARGLLLGAAAAWPFMHPQRVAGRWSLDGGYVDNAPLPPQSEAERAGTLVLLSRHYPRLPSLFQWHGRTYWQPSQPVPVSTWDCRASMVADTSAAYELGLRDAQNAWDSRQVRNGHSERRS